MTAGTVGFENRIGNAGIDVVVVDVVGDGVVGVVVGMVEVVKWRLARRGLCCRQHWERANARRTRAGCATIGVGGGVGVGVGCARRGCCRGAVVTSARRESDGNGRSWRGCIRVQMRGRRRCCR